MNSTSLILVPFLTTSFVVFTIPFLSSSSPYRLYDSNPADDPAFFRPNTTVIFGNVKNFAVAILPLVENIVLEVRGLLRTHGIQEISPKHDRSNGWQVRRQPDGAAHLRCWQRQILPFRQIPKQALQVWKVRRLRFGQCLLQDTSPIPRSLTGIKNGCHQTRLTNPRPNKQHHKTVFSQNISSTRNLLQPLTHAREHFAW